MQIKRLEQVLGKDLFDKSTRRIQLTREGEVLLHYARRILALNDEAKSRIAQSDLKGIIRIGTSDDYANILLPGVLNNFSNIYPGIQLDVVCDNGATILKRLHDNLIDIALVASLKDHRVGHHVRTERLVWISAQDGVTTNQISVPLAVFPEGCICRDVMIHALQTNKMSWWVAFSSDNIGAIHSAIRSGMAISAVEESIIPDGVRVLTVADGFPPLPEINVVVHKNQRSDSTIVDSLVREIVDSLSDEIEVIPLVALQRRSGEVRAAIAKSF
jgi:DNA-binding transcriptional LysR family regulator